MYFVRGWQSRRCLYVVFRCHFLNYIAPKCNKVKVQIRGLSHWLCGAINQDRIQLVGLGYSLAGSKLLLCKCFLYAHVVLKDMNKVPLTNTNIRWKSSFISFCWRTRPPWSCGITLNTKSILVMSEVCHILQWSPKNQISDHWSKVINCF